MNLASVMDEIATQVDTISGLRVYSWPPGSLTPPAAVVSYPTTYTFDATYQRGMDRLTLPLVVVVGKATERTTKERLGAYCNGSGASSIKAVVQAGTYTAFDVATVTGITFDAVSIGGTEYMAALFDIDIAGQGG
jgi:hypothetical protein